MTRLNHHKAFLQSAAEGMDKVQQQLSTGRKISRASEDPAGAALALGHRRSLAYETQMRRNLSSGRAVLNAGEAALGSATDAVQRARELAVQASTGTVSAADRVTMALEIDQIIGHVAQLANSTFGGAYLFSGHQSNAPAYLVTGNPPTAITYQGDAGLRTRRISEQDSVPVNLPGSDAFGTLFDDLLALRDDLNGSAPPAAITAHITTIDAGVERLIESRAKLGARANRFEAAESVSELRNVDLEKLRSEIEEVDITQTIVEFKAGQNTLEAALGAIGRTGSMTLLDFLR